MSKSQATRSSRGVRRPSHGRTFVARELKEYAKDNTKPDEITHSLQLVVKELVAQQSPVDSILGEKICHIGIRARLLVQRHARLLKEGQGRERKLLSQSAVFRCKSPRRTHCAQPTWIVKSVLSASAFSPMKSMLINISGIPAVRRFLSCLHASLFAS